MQRMNYLMAMLVVILSVHLSHGSADADEQPIGLTTGSETGTYLKIGQGVADATKGVMNIKVSPGGSLLNIDRIRNDRDYQFAIVQYDALVYKALLDPALKDQIRVIFPLYNEEIHILVRRDAEINSLQDLEGKRINVGPKETGPWITSSIIRALEELSWQDSNLLPQDALLALVENDIDGMIYTVGQPWGLAQMMDAETASQIKLLDYQSEELAPYFSSSVIPADTYPGQSQDVGLHATKAIMVTYNYEDGGDGKPARFSRYYEQIYDLVGAIVENLDDLRKNGHPKWKEIDPLDLSKVNWPAHQQAVKAIADLRPSTDEPAITKTDICKMFDTC